MNGKNLILITRPQPGAQDFARELKACGFETLAAPILEIVRQDFKAPDLSNYAGLIFTSANAVRLFAAVAPERDIPVLCIGQNTGQTAAALNYSTIHNSKQGGEALVSLVLEKAGSIDKPLLHPRGADLATPIAELLEAQGIIKVEELIIYKAKKARRLSPECITHIKKGNIDAATFFSKRTAENFMALISQNDLTESLKTIKALCLSEAVIECVHTDQWAGTYAAKRPDRQGMLKLVKDVCVPAHSKPQGAKQHEQERTKRHRAS